MQRLFSMFPRGRPGAALLLMRVALAILLVSGVAFNGVELGSGWLLIAPTVVAIALSLGLLTPVASALCVVLEVANWIHHERAIEAVHVCAILAAISLALLGPGGYSIDARLFGRRNLRIGSDDDRAE